MATEVLHGRIEQIFAVDNLSMPLSQLRAKTDVLDKKLIDQKMAPRVLHPLLKSFLGLRGEWKGKVKVKQIDCTKTFWSALPVEAEADETFFEVGKEGDASFRFYAQRNGTSMAPPVVRFAKSPQETVFLETEEHVNDPRIRSNSGECHYDGRLLKNDVVNLSTNAVEQDTLVSAVIINDKTRSKNKFFSEHVFRFIKTRPFELHVEIAVAQYGPDGRLWKRMLLEGDLR